MGFAEHRAAASSTAFDFCPAGSVSRHFEQDRFRSSTAHLSEALEWYLRHFERRAASVNFGAVA